MTDLTISKAPADAHVLEALFTFDEIAARGDRERRAELRSALDEHRLHIAWRNATPVGYYVLAPWWFGATFLQLLYVDASHRRGGVARRLIADAEDVVEGRLFTSTNQSNHPMQALLESLGWSRCGRLEGLDEGDPELFYRTA